MREKVSEVISKYATDFGFCEFSRVEPYLIPCRNISKIPENAKTVILILFPYYLGEEAYEDLNVSRYAAVPDYHTVANIYLEKISQELTSVFPDEKFIYFTDNSPISEVSTASAAGLGKIGRNGLLLNEKYGSWVFIGEIVTTLEFETDSKPLTYCENCGKCADECPVGALYPENFDKDICLSNISQKKGEIPDEYKELMKKYGCAWGCDICQKVCPYNKRVDKTYIAEFIDGFVSHVEEDCSVEGRAFAWRGEKVIHRNLKIINEDN